MTEQEKREKVIKGLEEAVDWLSTETSMTVIDQWVVRDALALLKGQEPRVMTLEALERWDGAVLVEYIGTFGQPICKWLLHLATGSRFVSFTDDRRSEVLFETAEYGKSWRCWTARPTDEQREAT